MSAHRASGIAVQAMLIGRDTADGPSQDSGAACKTGDGEWTYWWNVYRER